MVRIKIVSSKIFSSCLSSFLDLNKCAYDQKSAIAVANSLRSFGFNLEFDIIVDEMIHMLAFAGFEDEFALLDDVANNNNKFLI